MRHGVTILTDQPWAQARPLWKAAEDLGFDHAWTYDHLAWAGLPDSPWFAGVPTLTAAACVTGRIQLGFAVSAPNFRHPLSLFRDAQALDDISGGRFLLGVGTGGNLDAGILGQPELTVRQRVDRFQEFTDLLVRLRGEDHVSVEGPYFSTRDARTLPPVPHLPVVIAANGPRGVRYAARTAREGDGWMTLGPAAGTQEEWFAGLAGHRRIFEEELARAGRDPGGLRRYLMLDAPTIRPQAPFSLSSPEMYAEMTGRAGELGFTDVITHWPRREGPYQGDVAVLEAVAAQIRSGRSPEK